MSRIRLLITLVVISVIYFGWNHFSPEMVTTQTYNEYGQIATQEISSRDIPFKIYLLAMILGYLANWVNIVNEWERRPVLFFGRYYKTLEAGISLLEPLLFTSLDDISVQDWVQEVEVDNVQTKDNVGIALTGVLTYRIDETKVRDAVVEVGNVYKSVLKRAFSTLTDRAATWNLDNLLENRDDFCMEIQQKLMERVKDWGVVIKAFELKDFSINDDAIEQAIAMKARATKEGEAELVRAEMQSKIADALSTAAKSYTEEGRWLKGLEVVVELCRSGQNNTILVPTDLTESLARVMPITSK